ncbi:MAG: glycosyl transferase, partial [Nodosilinea sp.]
MPAPVLYIAITNHGFGHATRVASIAATVKALAPEVELIVATTAPRWLLAEYLPWEFEYHPVAFDIGVIQPDSLTLDRPATLAQLQQIQASQEQRVAAEVPFLQARRVQLVLADIPPLATALAQAAGVPCWMVGNFGWDFIYRALGQEFAEATDWVGECFAHCDRLFRLPFHEAMAAFPVVQEVGLTGGTPRYDTDHLRRRWQLEAPPERTILLTFGGLGLHTIPYDRLAAWPDWQ